MPKKDEYAKHAGEFINEAELQEELDDDELDVDEVEETHFEEDKDSFE
jgi:hypothetical protein